MTPMFVFRVAYTGSATDFSFSPAVASPAESRSAKPTSSAMCPTLSSCHLSSLPVTVVRVASGVAAGAASYKRTRTLATGIAFGRSRPVESSPIGLRVPLGPLCPLIRAGRSARRRTWAGARFPLDTPNALPRLGAGPALIGEG